MSKSSLRKLTVITFLHFINITKPSAQDAISIIENKWVLNLHGCRAANQVH